MPRRVPRVSVVIPTRDRARLVVRAIRSVLAQTVEDLELIVVDDGSTDDTAQLIGGIEDPRIQLITHDTPRGGAAARNTGIQASRAALVAFLDSDDEWLPRKLERQLAALEAAPPHTGVACAWATWIDGTGEEVDVSAPTLQGRVHAALLHSCHVGTTSTLLIRRADLDRVGGFDESLPAAQEWDLCIRLSRSTDFVTVPEVLVRYATSGDRITSDRDAVVRGHAAILDKHGEAIAAQGSDLEAVHHFRLGSLLCLARRMEEGRAELATAVRQNPRHPKYIAGWTASQMGPAAYRSLTRGNRALRRWLRRWRHGLAGWAAR